MPGVHAAHVSAVAAAHVCVTAVLSHVYCEDATLPACPASHSHVIRYGCEFSRMGSPTSTALVGAPMAAHALHVTSAGVHEPLSAPQLVVVGATP